MPGYESQDNNAIPYRYYDPAIKSRKAESQNLPLQPTSDRSRQNDDISTAYPAYPPPPYPVRVILLKPSTALFKASMERRTTSERRELEGGNPAGAVIELIQALPGRNQVDITSQGC